MQMASTETYKTPYGEIVEQESSDEEEDGIPFMEKLQSSIYLCRMTSGGKLLWSKPIDDVGHQDAALQAEASKDLMHSLQSLPCHKYRSLLPSPPVDADSGGHCPPNIRDAAWLRRTMRSILVRAIDVEKAATNCTACSSVTSVCFPVLAYRFFDTRSSDCGISSEATRLVEGLSLYSDPNLEERDDDRWGLYHGIRKMMVEDDDAEASVFFELLDECNGQDVLAFVLQVLIEVDNEMEESLLSSSSACDPVFLPLPLALELTSKLFASSCTESQGLQSADLNALAKKTMDLATEGSGENGAVELYVDLFQWLVLVSAREYCQEVSRRKSLARLLFETASTGTLSSYCPKSKDKSDCDKATDGINFPQFEAVMEVLWRGIPRNEIDELYCLSYEFQRNAAKYDGHDGISLEAFLHVADKRRFFGRSRR